MNKRAHDSIWLCNIRPSPFDARTYVGRMVNEDESGTYRDGPIYTLRDGAFERLLAAGAIESMEMEPHWYEETEIPLSEVRE